MRATVITTRLFRLSRHQLLEFNEKTKNREYNKDRRKDLSYFSFSFRYIGNIFRYIGNSIYVMARMFFDYK